MGARGRWLYLPLVALLGAAAAVLPSMASSETGPTVSAVSAGNYVGFAWSPEQVSAPAGGVVTFTNNSTYLHGIHWSGGPDAPACSGVPVDKAEASWTGTCTFAQPGSYSFYCSYHGPEMHGTVVVGQNGTVTTTETTPPPPATTPAPSPPSTSSASPLAGPTSQSLRLAKGQRGGVVKGSLVISKAGAGDELEIDLLASTASLSHRRAPAHTRVGRLLRASVAAGRLPFSIRLDPRARRALARRHRLALSVRIVLTPVYGEAVTIKRSVVEHG